MGEWILWSPKRFHLEITNMCVASCPFCQRTREWIDRYFELSISDIKKFFTIEMCQKIEQITYCWNFWDPIYAKDFLKIAEYFSTFNIVQTIHTNWYNKKQNYWNNLAKLGNIEIFWWIDWVQQKTHELHRVWTNLKQVLKNAFEFNKNWWRSIWQFIVFKQNELELKIAKKLSIILWFDEFVSHPSRMYSDVLEAPSNIKHTRVVRKKESFICKYERSSRFYINAKGQLMPCCWMAIIEDTDLDLLHESNNIRTNSFLEIQTSSQWIWKIGKFSSKTWENICLKKCWI